MKIIFLGSGTAFTLENYHSNILVESENHKRLLIDCGSDIRHSLHYQGLTAEDIDSIYISHLHFDHCGGLEWLAFARKFFSLQPKPNLFVQSDLRALLWQQVLKGGLSCLKFENTNIASFFTVKEVSNKNYFVWENIVFNLVQTFHMWNDKELVPSYGLNFTVNNQKIFITTDTVLLWDYYKNLYCESDVIFHDCELLQTPSKVHTTYQQLCQLDLEIKKKIWLYHYQPDHLPNATTDGFLGFVQKGQIFSF